MLQDLAAWASEVAAAGVFALREAETALIADADELRDEIRDLGREGSTRQNPAPRMTLARELRRRVSREFGRKHRLLGLIGERLIEEDRESLDAATIERLVGEAAGI